MARGLIAGGLEGGDELEHGGTRGRGPRGSGIKGLGVNDKSPATASRGRPLHSIAPTAR